MTPPARSALERGARRISLLLGDITQVAADAVINAASPELSGGGGVDGAIHRAAGPSVMIELGRVRPHGGCPPGSAVVTKAGRLNAKYIIHAVGPVWRGGGFEEKALLSRAYDTSLRLAEELRCEIVASPSISTGVYGYPVDKAAPVALSCAFKRVFDEQAILREIVFVLFDRATFQAYERALKSLG